MISQYERNLCKIECIIARHSHESKSGLRNDLHFVTGNGIERGREEQRAEKFPSYGDELKSS